MSVMERDFPWSLVEQALLEGSRTRVQVPCVFRDASMLGLVAASPVVSFSHDEYRAAIDRRALRRVRALRLSNLATAVVSLSGRQIGVLGVIVPTGRTFSTFAHVVARFDGAEVESVAIESGLVRELTGFGVQSRPDGETELVLSTAAERADLLEGDASATYWARKWRLPPRLARLAVLLMAGLSSREVGVRTGLSLRSVRTYTQELFALAGVHCRSELGPRALRDGLAPAGDRDGASSAASAAGVQRGRRADAGGV
jgi:DNA-binding CsgD family transcriptional regulator